jgi:hypothetical protein
MARDGFPATAGSGTRKTSVYPGMFMKRQQLREESQHGNSPFQKIKSVKTKRLAISIVGYQKAERR